MALFSFSLLLIERSRQQHHYVNVSQQDSVIWAFFNLRVKWYSSQLHGELPALSYLSTNRCQY